jgi:sensor histidine kinase YesM
MVVLFLASILEICMIYDTWFIWGVVEFFVSLGLLVCLFLERDNLNRENALVYSVDIFILLSYMIDFIAVYFGWWENTRLSMMFFVFIFIAAAMLVLKVIPENMEAAARAKELETEQKLLQAKLHESRISVMMSQIQPHFIYNSLAVIQELCHGEPEKAETAIGTLAEFLKGNMAISLSDKLVSFEDELKHTQKYLEIEHLRFEDQLRVVYDIRAGGFSIPALTIQPIVENAVRHGVRKKEEGGTVKITAAENENGFEIWVEDDGPGFKKREKTDGEGIHLGIENVRERLERMCEGELEIVSEEGKGTRVIIRIKKEFGTC